MTPASSRLCCPTTSSLSLRSIAVAGTSSISLAEPERHSVRPTHLRRGAALAPLRNNNARPTTAIRLVRQHAEEAQGAAHDRAAAGGAGLRVARPRRARRSSRATVRPSERQSGQRLASVGSGGTSTSRSSAPTWLASIATRARRRALGVAVAAAQSRDVAPRGRPHVAWSARRRRRGRQRGLITWRGYGVLTRTLHSPDDPLGQRHPLTDRLKLPAPLQLRLNTRSIRPSNPSRAYGKPSPVAPRLYGKTTPGVRKAGSGLYG